MSALNVIPRNMGEFGPWVQAATAEIKEANAKGESALTKATAAAENAAKALEAIEHGRATAVMQRDIGDKDGDIKRYVKPDGKVQLTTERRTLKIPGGPAVEYEAPGLLDDTQAVGPWHAELQRALGARALARLVMRAGTPTPHLDSEVARLVARAPAGLTDAIARSFVDQTNAGAEWIPDVFSPELYMAFEMPTMLEEMFETQQITGGSTLRPKITGQARPYLLGATTGAESDQDEPAKVPTTAITTDSQALTCPTFGMRFLIGYAAAEDSALMVQAQVQDQLIKGHRDGYEDCMVNGDTAATHQDTGIAGWNVRDRWGSANLGGSNDHRRAFIGFRAMATDRSCTVNQSSGMTVAKIMEELLGGMGEYAAADSLVITSPEVYFKKLLTDTNLLTVDKAGPAATIIARGLLPVAFIGGRPVVISRFVDQKYNTSGIYDNSTKTKSGVLVVARNAFKHYQKRGPTVEISRKPDVQRIEIVATRRKGMDTLTGSSEKVSMWGYGWTGVS